MNTEYALPRLMPFQLKILGTYSTVVLGTKATYCRRRANTAKNLILQRTFQP